MYIFRKRMTSANLRTFSTHNALVTVKGKLPLLRKCFGVMTPQTFERTTLEKHGRSNSVAVMYGKCGQRIGFCIAVILAIFFLTCARPIYTAFSRDEAIITKGIPIIYMCALVTAGQISQVVFSGCLRGAGDTLYIAVTSMISIALIRPVVSWYLCYPAGLGLYGAWYGVIIDQYLRLLLNGIRFTKGKWTKIVV